MKKLSVFLLILLVFALLFTACEDGSSGTEFSDVEIDDIAFSAIGSGHISSTIFGEFEGYSYNEASLEGDYSGLDVVGSAFPYIFIFVDVQFEPGSDIILNGTMDIDEEVSGNITVDFTGFNISSTDMSLNASIDGSITLGADSISGSITISGIASETVSVSVVVTDISTTAVCTSATINGTDYTSEFQDVLDSL